MFRHFSSTANGWRACQQKIWSMNFIKPHMQLPPAHKRAWAGMTMPVVMLRHNCDESTWALQEITDESPFLCVDFPPAVVHQCIKIWYGFCERLLECHGLYLSACWNCQSNLACIVQGRRSLLLGRFNSQASLNKRNPTRAQLNSIKLVICCCWFLWFISTLSSGRKAS